MNIIFILFICIPLRMLHGVKALRLTESETLQNILQIAKKIEKESSKAYGAASGGADGGGAGGAGAARTGAGGSDAGGRGAVGSAPFTTAAPIICGPVPDSLAGCLNDFRLVPPGVTSKCPVSKTPTQCSKFSCVASNAGWTNGTGWLDLQRVDEFMTRWAAGRPQWARAVERVRSACLGGRLPPQGTYLDCPAYDIFYCALAAIYKNAEASAWRTGPVCAHARAFAAACPICPAECFAPAIPIGSCNLCSSGVPPASRR